MENGMTVAEQTAALPAITFTREQIDLIKETVAKDTTDNELALFLYTAKRTGLDPLVRQIHAVKRGGKMAIQVGIDGFRLVADRTRNHAGTDDPVYEVGKDGLPVKATVTVYKIVNGQRCPFSATARWSEYFPGEAQGFQWKKMPFLMLGKCAEALALRKGFPAELSGVYAPEEMDQAERGPLPQQAETNGHAKPAAKKVSQPSSESGNQVTFVPTDVQEKSGTNKNGKPYTKWGVVHADGRIFGTFDKDLGRLAIESRESGIPLTLTVEQNGRFWNAVEGFLNEDAGGSVEESDLS